MSRSTRVTGKNQFKNKLYLKVQLLTLVTSVQADLNKAPNDIISRRKVSIHIHGAQVGGAAMSLKTKHTLSMESAKDQKASLEPGFVPHSALWRMGVHETHENSALRRVTYKTSSSTTRS